MPSHRQIGYKERLFQKSKTRKIERISRQSIKKNNNKANEDVRHTTISATLTQTSHKVICDRIAFSSS